MVSHLQVMGAHPPSTLSPHGTGKWKPSSWRGRVRQTSVLRCWGLKPPVPIAGPTGGGWEEFDSGGIPAKFKRGYQGLVLWKRNLLLASGIL